MIKYRLKNSWILIITPFFLLSLSVTGIAQIDTTRTTEQAAIDLMKIFDDVTEIATKTKLNADYVPGMVTVLHGEDLEARGYQTVWEALELVPGVEISIQTSGFRQIIVRGIGKNLVSSNVKILLNGVSMNWAWQGHANPVMEIPVSQIERIEIIRGPGSAVHGEFAYSGVIHFITKKEDNIISTAAGKFGSIQSAGIFYKRFEKQNVELSLNIAGWKTDGSSIRTGQDRLYSMGLGNISNAPGRTNEAHDHGLGILLLKYEHLELLGQITQVGRGDYFGLANALSTLDEKISGRFSSYGLEGKIVEKNIYSMNTDFKIGWLDSKFKFSKTPFFPKGFPGLPDGMISASHYVERRFYSDLELTKEINNKHMFLLAWSVTSTKISDVYHETNYRPSTFVALASGQFQKWTGDENFIPVGKSRLLQNITLQSEFQLNPSTTLTTGIRFDHYDDVGLNFSPRIAGVFRKTENHILKVQFAGAFRPPMFLEMYAQNNPVVKGTENIKPETIDTFEGSYIYRNIGSLYRLTFYRSKLEDLILVKEGIYQNSGNADLKGIEIEIERSLNNVIKIDANVSFVDAKDLNDNNIPDVGRILSNFGISFNPVRNMLLNIQYRHVGTRYRDINDPRKDLGGYDSINLTANLFEFISPAISFKAGIKNILNDSIVFPAPVNTYPDDYPRPGRRWWMQLSYTIK